MLDNQDREEFLSKLIKFLRIPSISGDFRYRKDILSAVKFLKQELLEAGFSRTKIEELYAKGLNNSSNNPVLFAERLNNPEAPTVLIYGHYDVQAPEPLSEWISSPFDPKIRNGNIYARGATDDKGQLYTHIAALKILKKKWGEKWPVNIKIIIEGEEESGGENLEKLIFQNPKKFGADVCIVSDTGFVADGTPSLEVSLRGIVYFEIEVKTGDKDLHSGLYGGSVRNPINILTQVLAKIQDLETGVITIPNFFNDVPVLSKKDKLALKKIPFNKEEFLKETGAEGLFGEEGFSTVERQTSRPSFDLNGIVGGFTGEGSKTVIPNKASAKFSLRILAGQNPDKVSKLVENFISKISPKDVQVKIKTLHKGEGFLANPNSKYLKLAENSLRKIFKKDVVFARSGGSIPVIPLISRELKTEIVLMGYGLPDDNLHSPNEKFSLDQFFKGIECNIEFLRGLENQIP
jgi:acetylornithine deacetylase/succinyl-diaminopimelate desuccinylase-like protein